MGIDQQYLSKKLALSSGTMSGRFTGRCDWRQDEMYLTMEILKIPVKEMHRYFPQYGEERSEEWDTYIAEEMYLSADELQYELGKMSMVKDKKPKEKETFVLIYYYSTFDAVIRTLSRYCTDARLREAEKWIWNGQSKNTKITADFERRMDTMKANITKDLAFEKWLESASKPQTCVSKCRERSAKMKNKRFFEIWVWVGCSCCWFCPAVRQRGMRELGLCGHWE